MRAYQRRIGGSARLRRKPTTTSGASGRGQPLGQPADVRHLELAVAVDEGDQLEASGPEAGPESGPVAQVRRVVDDPERRRDAWPRARRRWPACGRVEPSSTAMISNLLGQRRQGAERLVDQSLEIGLLVVGREEERQLRDRRPSIPTAVCRAGPAAALTGFPFGLLLS